MEKKIVFFQVGPGVGPITNNNFRFAKALMLEGISIELLGTNVHSDVFSSAPRGMGVATLNAPSFLEILLPLIGYLRKAKPDVMLVSGLTLHVLSCIAKRITGYPKVLVLRIHAHTTSLLSDRSWLNRRVLLTLMRITHNWSDFKVSASRGAADDWAHLLGAPVEEVRVMYNPAVGEDLLEKSEKLVADCLFDDSDTLVIITVARLAPEKSLHVLLQAFSILAGNKRVRLVIFGEGPLRSGLQTLATELGISELVDFRGWVENPFAYMAKADLFVLTSWYEGFANVIAESLACGCPVVSTDAPSGPREILQDGKYGRLVPVGDVHALASEMRVALDSPVDRDALRARGMRFHVNQIIWDARDIFLS